MANKHSLLLANAFCALLLLFTAATELKAVTCAECNQEWNSCVADCNAEEAACRSQCNGDQNCSNACWYSFLYCVGPVIAPGCYGAYSDCLRVCQ